MPSVPKQSTRYKGANGNLTQEGLVYVDSSGAIAHLVTPIVMTSSGLLLFAPTDAANNPIASTTRATTVALNQASVARTTNGNTANLAVGNLSELSVCVSITAVSGTTPTMTLYLDTLGADGVWYLGLWSSAQVTTVSQVITSVGSRSTTNQVFGNTVRLRWVIGGTTPSFTFSASILGK